MDSFYIKKEGIIRKCIEEGGQIFTPYQMQVIKSKFYVALTFDKDSDEYKKRIDEVYKYTKDNFDKYHERIKRKENGERLKKERKAKNKKVHNYIEKKEANCLERVQAINDNSPLPDKYETSDRLFRKLNIIYNVRERLYTNNIDIYEIIKEDNNEVIEYLRMMIEHAFASYVALGKLNEKYPRYYEARQKMFDFIKAYSENPVVIDYEMLVKIIRDEELLRQFMFEVNPLYMDKLSDEYKMITEAKRKFKKENPAALETLKNINSSIKNIKLNNEIIKLIVDFEEPNKTL